ncbi:hypothetical protein HU200_029735 [Digitaria exilis]|uniref:non-specific serine/threonine protein kinase n=1 Tax=Digitaria exilis TaxID=1010633 RepID=A0A835EP48_9POAL|nr:hypothetical protein HU200_029735 [Digitaria exilis]
MGNTCVGPSAAGRNGFLANVTLWRPRGEAAPAPALPPPSSPATSDKQAPDPVTIPESEHSSHHSSRSSDQPPPASAAATQTPPQDNPPAKKPVPKVKRVQSAGLLADSVLKRDVNTARLKDLYTIGKKLGQGQFGTTYLCVEKATGKEFACKSIAKRKLLTEEDVEDVRREIQIMHHLAGHANVVSIVGAYEDAVAVQLVMELCAGGELFDRIIQRGHYSEKAAAQLTRVIVGVVEACHSLGVMHRDLKPENFLFVNQKEDSPLKAIDFGLSIFFKPVAFIEYIRFHIDQSQVSAVIQNVKCLRMSLEAHTMLHLRFCSNTMAVRLTCGVLLALICFFFLFISGAESEQGIFEQVLKGDLDFSSEPWPSISESAKDLVRKMLIRDPKKRLTAHEALCHPWVCIDGVAPDKPLDSAVLSRLKQFSAMNKLKKMALRVIAESLSEEEIAGLKEMFKMLDADNSGHITLEELKTGLQRVGATLMDSEINALMEAADIDNSGTIDYGEFIAATLHINKVEKEDKLFAAFSYFDKDGSGYITQDELQKACEEFGIGDTRLEDIIGDIDQDNDGRIDYNEFVAMMQKGDNPLGRKGHQSNANFGLGEALKLR